MSEIKLRCPNCGAFLQPDDKECYVCGELVLPSVPSPGDNRIEYKKPSPPEIKPEPKHSAPKGFSDVYTDDDYEEPGEIDFAEPYEDEAHLSYDEVKRRSSKKVIIVCAICVAVALLAAVGVWLCNAMGVFGGGDEKKSVTVYFDKPASGLNLIDSEGKVYNWRSDVSACYTDENGEEKTVGCSPMLEYDNLWKCDLPSEASQVYFIEEEGSKIKTQIVPELADENVYYVTQIMLNSDLQLPIAGCNFADFRNLGVNYTEQQTTADTTAATTAPTKATSESTAESTTEPTTQAATSAARRDIYTVSIPESWESGAIVEEKGNCTTYYEKYNKQSTGEGMLLSIYVFDANDTSYGDLTVKKIIPSSDNTKKIVVVTPSDVQFDETDETATTKYINLENYTNQVINSIKAN